MCTHCEKVEKILENVTPELEQMIEALSTGVAARIQEDLGKKFPVGLPRAVNDVIAAAALMSLAEAFTKNLPKERADLATKIAVRIIATSESIKAKHAPASAGGLRELLDAAMRGAIPVTIEKVPGPGEKH